MVLLVLGYILLTITRSGSSCSWLYDVDDYEEWLFLFLDTLSCITVGGLPENWFFSCWWLYMGVYYRKRLRPVVHLVVGYILIVDHYEERFVLFLDVLFYITGGGLPEKSFILLVAIFYGCLLPEEVKTRSCSSCCWLYH